MQNVGALRLLIQCSLNRFHLPANAPHSIEQFLFLLYRMRHEKALEPFTRIPRRVYAKGSHKPDRKIIGLSFQSVRLFQSDFPFAATLL
jgi:hypothetical protein